MLAQHRLVAHREGLPAQGLEGGVRAGEIRAGRFHLGAQVREDGQLAFQRLHHRGFYRQAAPRRRVGDAHALEIARQAVQEARGVLFDGQGVTRVGARRGGQ
ncbi:hypothetical protein D3C72_1392050 [compost metagenome]